MKVWQLRKITEIANEIKYYSIDYELLLKMNQKDIDLLIDQIDYENEGIDYLINFLEFTYENPEWKENYNHMEGIENFDLKEYLFHRIATAFCNEDASAILSYFDFNQEKNKLSIFKSIEEWKTYVENINSNLSYDFEIKLSNLDLILKNSKEGENRVNLIKRTMNYLQTDELEFIDFSKCSIDWSKLPITFDDLLDLLLKEYDPTSIMDLLDYWIKQRENTSLTENKEMDDGFQVIINYLKESSMMNGCYMDSFVDMVKDLSFNEYNGFVYILREIEEQEDYELLETCIRREASFKNRNMRIYVTRVLCATNEYNYRTAQFRLWENGTIDKYLEDETNMNRIMNGLILAKDHRLDCLELAELIENIPTVEMIKYLDMSKVEKDTFEMLRNRFDYVVKKEDLSEEEVENYANLLGSLSSLPKDICSKVISILGFKSVKTMELEDRKKLQETLLNPENYDSLDYILQEYQTRENNLQSQLIRKPQPVKQDIDSSNTEVKLLTVLELLENGANLDKVLDGFTDDDEITPKTLIRSLAYKNKQN